MEQKVRMATRDPAQLAEMVGDVSVACKQNVNRCMHFKER